MASERSSLGNQHSHLYRSTPSGLPRTCGRWGVTLLMTTAWVWLGAAGVALSQPVNDLFQNRTVLDGTYIEFAASNAGAGKEVGEPQHAGNAGGRSVWWTWTVPENGVATVTLFDCSFDALFAVYTGSTLTGLTPVMANAGTPQGNAMSFRVQSGMVCQIAVDGRDGASGDFVMLLVFSPTPLNDDLGNRAEIFGAEVCIPAVNVEATKEPDEPNHAGNAGGRSVWWVWNPPAGHKTTISTAGSAFDTLLAVYTGTDFSDLALVAQNDNAATVTNTSAVVVYAMQGTPYYIAVDGAGGQSGNLRLRLQQDSAPVNDEFIGRIPITGLIAGGNAATASASREPGEPLHAGNIGGHSLWWSWTAPEDGSATITLSMNSFEVLLAVYTGTNLASLTPVVANNQVTNQTVVTFYARAGVTYQIALDGRDGQTGSSAFLLQVSSTPANDDFAQSGTLSSSGANVLAFNRNATKQPGEPNHAGNAGGQSVWWNWTAPAARKVTVSTAGTGFDTLLAVYTGTNVSSLTLVAANDNASAGVTTSTVVFESVEGLTYRIAVDGHDGQEGDLVLTLAHEPINNDFSARFVLSGNAAEAKGANDNADKEPGEPAHVGNAGGHSIWWSWTAPFTGRAVVLTKNSDIDTLLAVYTGPDVAHLAPVAANDDASRYDATSKVVFDTTSGTSYQFAVDGWNGAEGQVDVSLSHGVIPVNDDFADRIALSGTTVSAAGTNAFASKEPGEPHHAGDVGGHSVWWTWTAPANGAVTISTPDVLFKTLLAVYTGNSVTNLTLVANDLTRAYRTNMSEVRFDATAGVSYQIAVDGFQEGTGRIGLQIEQTPGRYSLNLASSPMGADAVVNATPPPAADGKYAAGTPVTLSAAPGANLRFHHWSGDASGSAASTVVTVNRSGTAAANFVPANDTFSQAALLEGASGRVTGCNDFATRELGEPAHAVGAGGKSIWWTWTAPLNGQATLRTTGSSLDTVLAVYVGSSLAGLELVARNDDLSTLDARSEVRFEAQARTVYRIAVDGFGGSAGNVELELETATADPTGLVRLQAPAVEPDGRIALRVLGEPGVPLFVETSPDLLNWQPLVTTNTPDGVFDLRIQPASGAGAEFFRAAAILPTGFLRVLAQQDADVFLPAPGAAVYVDRILAGTTGDDGVFAAAVSAGQHEIHVNWEGFQGAQAEAQVSVGATNNLELTLNCEGLIEPAGIESPQLVNGLLGYPFAALSFGLLDAAGRPLPLTQLDDIHLELPEQTAQRSMYALMQTNQSGEVTGFSNYFDLTGQFTLDATGRVVATNVAALAQLLEPLAGELRLSIQGEDRFGFIYSAELSFQLGRYYLSGQVVSPGFPALPLTNVAIKASLLNGGAVLTTTTDASGQFLLWPLPDCNVALTALTDWEGRLYRGQAMGPINTNIHVTLPLDEPVAGEGEWPTPRSVIPAYLLSPPVPSPQQSPRFTKHGRGARGEDVEELPPSAACAWVDQSPAHPTEVSLGIKDCYENMATVAAVPLMVPRYTTNVYVRYTVGSFEYTDHYARWPCRPYQTYPLDFPWEWLTHTCLVEQNDSVELTVRAGKKDLSPFPFQCDIISLRPLMTMIGALATTEELVEEVKVSEYTQSGETEVSIWAKIQDVDLTPWIPDFAGLPYTELSATLTLEAPFWIKEIVRDEPSYAKKTDFTYYSLPHPGQMNKLRRHFTLKLGGRPAGSEITKVQVRLRNSSGLDKLILDMAPDKKKVIDLTSKLVVEITDHGDHLVELPVVPDFHNFTYHFTVECQSGGKTLTAKKASPPCHALWRMPVYWWPEERRYSLRDLEKGGDDWSAKGTYEWLEVNQIPTLTRINDVSGEHGADLVHDTHLRGTDIDIFQYLSLDATSGGLNYWALVRATTNALYGHDTDAFNDVKLWVTTNRIGITRLLGDPMVRKVLTGSGAQHPGAPNPKAKPGTRLTWPETTTTTDPAKIYLPAGWLTCLMRDGQLTFKTNTLQLNVGPWKPEGVKFDPGHNDHVHITLNEDALNNHP